MSVFKKIRLKEKIKEMELELIFLKMLYPSLFTQDPQQLTIIKKNNLN